MGLLYIHSKEMLVDLIQRFILIHRVLTQVYNETYLFKIWSFDKYDEL
nr:MAG TPA: hypothetical protein [Caudoviricetes sp.]